jgi:hypothetical protein
MSRQANNVPPGLTARDLAWDAMREDKTFTVDDLVKRTRVSRGTIEDYVKALVKAGIVVRSGERPAPQGNAGSFPRAEYTVVGVSLPLEAPRVRKDGTLLPAPGRQRLWRVMGILKEFSVRDLVAAASLPEAPVASQEALYYCRWLTKGGYLRVTSPGRYLAVPAMRHGPRAPLVQRVRRLLDPNTGEITAESEPVEEKAR